MTLDQSTELIRHCLWLALLIAAPILAVGLIVGVIVSLFQAVTQVQDQTVSLIPKLLIMLFAVLLLLPWSTQHVIEYARDLFSAGLK
jgi:flagellar biosynthesis protein FliQ